MMHHLLIAIAIFCNFGLAHAVEKPQDSIERAKKTIYPFSSEPIDVVIPAISKDLETLDLCIEGIKNNCSQVRRVIVVSASQLTDKAEWVDEVFYPFSKYDVALHLNKGDHAQALKYLTKPGSRLGWYYQQLLKLYAAYVIPDISSNVLVLDADIIFLNPVEFLNSASAGLYKPSTQSHTPYYKHAKRLVPGFKKGFYTYSGIADHMIFQKCVLDDLFATVEKYQKIEFWKAFCACVDEDELEGAGASEYEIYFNFVFTKSNQVKIRSLQAVDLPLLAGLELLKAYGSHYVSCHAWRRTQFMEQIGLRFSDPTNTNFLIPAY